MVKAIRSGRSQLCWRGFEATRCTLSPTWSSRKNMAVPGFEPGSSGSQPLMLTTTLYHHRPRLKRRAVCPKVLRATTELATARYEIRVRHTDGENRTDSCLGCKRSRARFSHRPDFFPTKPITPAMRSISYQAIGAGCTEGGWRQLCAKSSDD